MVLDEDVGGAGPSRRATRAANRQREAKRAAKAAQQKQKHAEMQASNRLARAATSVQLRRQLKFDYLDHAFVSTNCCCM